MCPISASYFSPPEEPSAEGPPSWPAHFKINMRLSEIRPPRMGATDDDGRTDGQDRRRPREGQMENINSPESLRVESRLAFSGARNSPPPPCKLSPPRRLRQLADRFGQRILMAWRAEKVLCRGCYCKWRRCYFGGRCNNRRHCWPNSVARANKGQVVIARVIINLKAEITFGPAL